MSISYIWDFGPLESYPTSSNYTDVVFAVHWKLYASSGSYTVKDYGVQYVNIDTGSVFIPFNELTKDIVYGWVTSSMELEGIDINNQYYLPLEQKLIDSISPTTIAQQVPW